MDPKLIILFKLLTIVHSIVINDTNNITDILIDKNSNINSIFNGVYSECFMHLSYMCLQKKTLLYLKELNSLSEVSVFGDYVKFVKLNTTNNEERSEEEAAHNTEELAFMIDRAVDKFFDNHVLKFNALGKDIIMPRNVEEFVGRKKRKGGGGGGGHMSEDGGKKKMMMMAMMCMKMKLMMMVPAMMGMMGMMSFKGMMFSMMSFMLSKMMLLMKILEKKGGSGLGGGGSGGGDGGWMAASGGGGAWMPAGGQDFGGGGYDANGQWQSRSIVDNISKHKENKPTITYVKPVVRYSNGETNQFYKTPVLVYKKSNVNFDFDKEPVNSIDQIDKKNSEVMRKKRDVENVFMESSVADGNQENKDDGVKNDNDHETNFKENDNLSNINDKSSEIFYTTTNNDKDNPKTRTKRGILDLLQNSYVYWMNKFLGLNNNRRTAFQRYKVVNGVKYVYYPYPFKVQKQKTPKDINLNNNEHNDMKANDELKPVIAAEDFNKGEIMEGSVQSRMMKKKLTKMKETVNEAMEDNPWE